MDHSSVVHNWVNGGEALGGGIYAGPGTGAGIVTLRATDVNANQAIAEDVGVGIGGGIYNVGAVELDEASNVHGNTASTSHDDIFGDLAVLNALLAV